MFTERYNNALEYVSLLHCNQTRKGTETPYISHLVAVSLIALEHGANEDEAIAALLHDAVEDQGGLATLKAIETQFGKNVANIVAGCTDSIVDTQQGEAKLPWQSRKEQYIAHLATVEPSVRLVSTADKYHNAMSILRDYKDLNEALWSRFTGGKAGTLWYYRALVEAFKKHESSPLVNKLEQIVAELEQLAG